MFGLVKKSELMSAIEAYTAALRMDLTNLIMSVENIIQRVNDLNCRLSGKVSEVNKKIDKTHSSLQSHVDIKTNALEARIAKLEAQLVPPEPTFPITAPFNEAEFQESLDLRTKA